jgi:hypothetical protein
MARTRLLAWRPVAAPDGSLIGHCDIEHGSGLRVKGVAVHRAGSRRWCTPPAIVWFSGHGTRSAWSRVVLRALDEFHDRGEGA